MFNIKTLKRTIVRHEKEIDTLRDDLSMLLSKLNLKITVESYIEKRGECYRFNGFPHFRTVESVAHRRILEEIIKPVAKKTKSKK